LIADVARIAVFANDRNGNLALHDRIVAIEGFYRPTTFLAFVHLKFHSNLAERLEEPPDLSGAKEARSR
jgi:hypothetical protein